LPKTNAQMRRCALAPSVKTRRKGRQRVWRTRWPGKVQTTWWERMATTERTPARCTACVQAQLAPYRLSASTPERGKPSAASAADQLPGQLRRALVDIARL
jgi:hypothetical protein